MIKTLATTATVLAAMAISTPPVQAFEIVDEPSTTCAAPVHTATTVSVTCEVDGVSATSTVHLYDDLAGRPPGHAMYGHDSQEEDEAGWDCRYQGNGSCGATEYDHDVRWTRLGLCDDRFRRFGDQDRWISCVDRAYTRPIWS